MQYRTTTVAERERELDDLKAKRDSAKGDTTELDRQIGRLAAIVDYQRWLEDQAA